MICEDCLIWQNRFTDLVRIWEPLPGLYAQYGMSNKQMAQEFKELWTRKDRVNLTGKRKCSKGKCRLN